MSQNRFLAVTVMTYRHPQVVDHVLSEWEKYISDLGFDIYYFDSSPDNETEQIVRTHQEKCSHIYYKRFPSELSVEIKFLTAFDKSFYDHSYRYIWPIKDRAFPDAALMLNIYQRLIEGCDVLEITAKHTSDIFKPYRYTDTYTSAGEFYRDLAWCATSIENTIYNADTILHSFDKGTIVDRYFVNGRSYFPHTLALFHYLSELKRPVISCLRRGKGSNALHYDHNASSGWTKTNVGLQVFGYYWPLINRSLPECYSEYRRDAVRSETNFYPLLGSVDGLINLNFNDPSNAEYADRLLEHWSDYSDVPYEIATALRKGDFTTVYERFRTELQELISQNEIQEASELCFRNSWIRTYTDFCNNEDNASLFSELYDYCASHADV